VRSVYLAAVGVAGLAGLARTQDAPENRVQLAEIALVGPLRKVEIDYADGSGATLEIEVRAGERRTLSLALPIPAGGAQLEPRIAVDGAGTARIDWHGSQQQGTEPAWARVPMSLRQRPLPPAPASGGGAGPPLAAWFLACAGFALALRWRDRGVLALLGGAAGGAAAFTVAELDSEPIRDRVVLEGVADSPIWLNVRVGAGRLDAPTDLASAWIETRPVRAPLRMRAREGPRGVEGTLESPRGAIYRLAGIELGTGLAARAGPNRLASFVRTWVRDPDGTWTRRGAWSSGESLPGADDGEGEPPSWIQPALPLGAGILIAEQAPDPALAERGAETWVRLVGF
jgi:hypothetical protein